MLRFVPDQLKNKKMCKNAVKKLLLVTKYVPDWYKTQEMFEVILENGIALIFVSNCYKNQKMRNKADKVLLEKSVTLMFVPNCYKSQQICNKAVDNYAHALEFAPDCHKTPKKV